MNRTLILLLVTLSLFGVAEVLNTAYQEHRTWPLFCVGVFVTAAAFLVALATLRINASDRLNASILRRRKA